MPSPVQSNCDAHDTIANGQYGAVGQWDTHNRVSPNAVQTWRGGREHREEPKLHRKAWVESDRWRCTRARKVGNVVSSFQTRTACNEHVSFYELRVGGYPFYLRPS
ncbi:hypothetical protein TNCV_105991 [Trichonephila clavipes]|nr:hypothetical protein TNCV_105991 [Trichonephila clavipes]